MYCRKKSTVKENNVVTVDSFLTPFSLLKFTCNVYFFLTENESSHYLLKAKNYCVFFFLLDFPSEKNNFTINCVKWWIKNTYKCHYTASYGYTNKIWIMTAKHSVKMLVRLTDYPRSNRIKQYLINIIKIRAQWWASEPNITEILSTYFKHVSKFRSCKFKKLNLDKYISIIHFLKCPVII